MKANWFMGLLVGSLLRIKINVMFPKNKTLRLAFLSPYQDPSSKAIHPFYQPDRDISLTTGASDITLTPLRKYVQERLKK